jgi:hypothetical protein
MLLLSRDRKGAVYMVQVLRQRRTRTLRIAALLDKFNRRIRPSGQPATAAGISGWLRRVPGEFK